MPNGVVTPSRGLGELILDQGIQNTYFFNGRLLTGSDLQTEQMANHQYVQLLGQAIGEGIVKGLDVSVVSSGGANGPPILAVTAGLALNRSGETIHLPLDIQ